jgi:hypothetical protein
VSTSPEKPRTEVTEDVEIIYDNPPWRPDFDSVTTSVREFSGDISQANPWVETDSQRGVVAVGPEYAWADRKGDNI